MDERTEEYARGSWMFWNEVLVPVDPIQIQFHYCSVWTLGWKDTSATETY